MKKINKYLILWMPPVFWASIQYIFSSNPTIRASEVTWQDFIIKKSFHFFFYAILSLLLYRALRGSDIKKSKSLIFSFLLASIYGITDEFHQSFTPGREPTIRDILIDSAGAGLAMYFYNRYFYLLPAKIKKAVEQFGFN